MPSFNQSNCSGLTCLAVGHQLWFGLLFSLIVTIGILGNAFVIAVILLNRKMLRASINVLLLNLALADLGNLLVCVPDVVMVVADQGWLLHPLLCRIVRFGEELFLYESLLLQVMICIERYLAICSPLKVKRLSLDLLRPTLIMLWLFAFTFAIPYAIYHERIPIHKFGTEIEICVWISRGNETFFSVFKYAECIVYFFLPLILLTTLYTRTACRLWGSELHESTTTSTRGEVILQLRRSVVKMLIICLTIYFLCYTPIQIIFVSETIFHKRVFLTQPVRLLLNALTLANSAANPIVYTICCKQFRLKLIRMFRGTSLPYEHQLLAAKGRTAASTLMLLDKGSCMVTSVAFDSYRGERSRQNSGGDFLCESRRRKSSRLAGYESIHQRLQSTAILEDEV